MKDLFDDFKPSTAEEWKNRIIREQKGSSFEDLIWHNENGFDIEPFYNHEHLEQKYSPAFLHSNWEICAEGNLSDSSELNLYYLRQLNSGASSISFVVGDHDVKQVLSGIGLNFIRSVFFINRYNSERLISYLEKEYDPKTLNCCIFDDGTSEEEGIEYFSKFTEKPAENKNISVLTVNALPYHNQGCTASYEIAIIFSMLIERMEGSGKDYAAHGVPSVVTGITTDYFMQVAKLRALRRLWNVIRKEYDRNDELYIITRSTLTNKTISDSYNNLLRTTVEAMAAVTGGCNELILSGFDVLLNRDQILSERMSVNQQLILKEECYLDKVADISCGSFYIENLTDKLAITALELFKKFEEQGGYKACLKKDIFRKDIEEQSRHNDSGVQSLKNIIVGVNKFRNEGEKISLDPRQINELKKLSVQNPGLRFELENHFKLKNA